MEQGKGGSQGREKRGKRVREHRVLAGRAKRRERQICREREEEEKEK